MHQVWRKSIAQFVALYLVFIWFIFFSFLCFNLFFLLADSERGGAKNITRPVVIGRHSIWNQGHAIMSICINFFFRLLTRTITLDLNKCGFLFLFFFFLVLLRVYFTFLFQIWYSIKRYVVRVCVCVFRSSEASIRVSIKTKEKFVRLNHIAIDFRFFF